MSKEVIDPILLLEEIEERLEVNLIYLIHNSKLAKQYKTKIMKEVSSLLPIIFDGAKSNSTKDAYFTRKALQLAELCRRIVLSVNFPSINGDDSKSDTGSYAYQEQYDETIYDLLNLFSIIDKPIDLDDNWEDEI